MRRRSSPFDLNVKCEGYDTVLLVWRLFLKILVVEDERELNQMIRDYLDTLGWETIAAYTGTQALDLFRSEAPDFLLLDLMIPGLDGMDVMRRIREVSQLPIIMITLMGLELGADDYITKPFSIKELAARMRAVYRRVNSVVEPDPALSGHPVLKVGDLTLNSERRTLSRGAQAIELTAVQFDIIHGFMRHPGRVFSRNEILEFFQDIAWDGYERTIDVHIKNIRKQLEPDRENPRYLETVRGVGYRLAEYEGQS